MCGDTGNILDEIQEGGGIVSHDEKFIGGPDPVDERPTLKFESPVKDAVLVKDLPLAYYVAGKPGPMCSECHRNDAETVLVKKVDL